MIISLKEAVELADKIDEAMRNKNPNKKPRQSGERVATVAAICRHFEHRQDEPQSSLHSMTLRQQYAMAAMQGFLANPDLDNGLETTVARWAFKQADEMIKFEQQEHSCLSKEKKDET